MLSLLNALILFISFCALAHQATASEDAREQEARALVQEFAGRLKPQLQQALQEGGPRKAVEVCASQAPKIADAISLDSGWQVKRVSLRSRNASRATPDFWERAVLERFDARQASGENAANLTDTEVVGGRFRFMQAQATEPLCLICHGQQLADDVREVLQEYYPHDQATGYRAGQVRGAFSLSTR
jgi:hypothetical protein